ncbi:P-loop containing nucleoside triphosphate hydrolase protein [Hyaloscypha variabilis F]|uniref:P-loop containing nucleoside triphosphate hydrolase protein n=1 Tax=Hyaloscypha variabilis (strain UAMH 11265 / GT02V1 / F) TaxID=1149755 RepID=A0A2J6QY11_HYAVF|nr:P-loop containing nucleoside triphosphate hydrolase protein [Hyaloscypha variabilis F]
MINRNSGVYHTTSVDVAKSKHRTLIVSGQKRSYGDFQERQGEAHVLVNTTNLTDFHRPTEQQDNSFPRLEAGQIQDVIDRGQSVYSQRRDLALTPTVTCNPLLDLSHPAYGLPKQLIDNFASVGIKSIYPWQSECLLKSGALRGEKNLVYTAPTGGGKSLVADVLMLKKVIDTPGKKAMLVLPYVALVQEKMRWLRKVVEGIVKTPASPLLREQRPWRKRGDEDLIKVAGFFGGSKSKVTWEDMDIAVCTIEKANSLVNIAIDDLSIGTLGVVVMDEMHMIDDESRGYILELMATKLLSLEQWVQIIGMSATLNNAELLARWLDNAKFYVSRYRPVPVEEHLVFDNAVYPASSTSRFYKTATQLNTQSRNPSQSKPEPARLITQSRSKELSSTLINAVVALSNETARAGYGALVFCSSRAGCEKDAIMISQVLPRAREIDSCTAEKRRDLLNDLRSTTTGLDPILEKIIPIGVAFHHAGLTTEERDAIAVAYDQGVINVIVATCSLAAGINLPARRVILHGARMGAELVGPSMLRQMRGRAGRKGKDEVGETYLCCQKSDLEAVAELMEADIPSVESCLLPGKRGIKRALLEVIATRLATSNDSIDDYVRRTLLYYSIDRNELAQMVLSTVQELKETGLIDEIIGSEYSATPLGQAIVTSSLTPEDGLFVHRELRKAMGAFVMDGEMHVLYSFTPVQAAHGDINWQIFRKEVDCLDESNLRVLEFVGLKPLIINKMAQGGSMKESTAQEIEIARIYRRFYTALQLRDLCNEMPVHAVARKYDIPRGTVQTLAQTCQGFAAGMIKFCERMNWGALAAVLDHFSDRLKAGAKSDLLALAKVTYIKSRTARIFWENGFKSVAAVAAADVKDILPVLLLAQPRKPRLNPEEEEKYISKLKVKAEIISKSANYIWEKEMQAELDEEE